jgi:hypothetical protein
MIESNSSCAGGLHPESIKAFQYLTQLYTNGQPKYGIVCILNLYCSVLHTCTQSVGALHEQRPCTLLSSLNPFFCVAYAICSPHLDSRELLSVCTGRLFEWPLQPPIASAAATCTQLLICCAGGGAVHLFCHPNSAGLCLSQIPGTPIIDQTPSKLMMLPDRDLRLWQGTITHD